MARRKWRSSKLNSGNGNPPEKENVKPFNLNVHGFRGYPENREITTKEVLEGAIISHAWFMQVSEEDLNVDILLSKIGDDQVPIILRCEGQHYIYGHDGSIPHIKKLEKSSREPSPLVEA